MTVLSPGAGAPLIVDDLGLKKKYGTMLAASQCATYNDLMVEVSGPSSVPIPACTLH